VASLLAISLCVASFAVGRALGQREGTEEDRRRENQQMGPDWIRRMYSE